METTTEILKLNEVAEILGYKNRRSAIRWCINNGVELINHIGSCRKFVRASQFYFVFYGKVAKKTNVVFVENDNIQEMTRKVAGRKRINNSTNLSYVEYYKSILLQKFNKI